MTLDDAMKLGAQVTSAGAYSEMSKGLRELYKEICRRDDLETIEQRWADNIKPTYSEVPGGFSK